MALLLAGVTAACSQGPSSDVSASTAAAPAVPAAQPAGCDAGNGGLTLPSGFCASVFADNLGHARHLAVAANGDVYVNTMSGEHNKFTNAPRWLPRCPA
jgi:hypothetical protein